MSPAFMERDQAARQGRHDANTGRNDAASPADEQQDSTGKGDEGQRIHSVAKGLGTGALLSKAVTLRQ